jgi:putative heme-binding domain-containing protein
MLTTILAAENPPASLAEQLFALAAALNDQKAFAQVLAEVAKPGSGGYAAWQFAALAGLLDALERRGQTLAQLLDRNGGGWKQIVAQLEPLFARAREGAAQPATLRAPWPELRLMGRDGAQADADIARLGELLGPQISGEIQRAALAALRKINRPKVPEVLVSRWSRLGPGLRAEAIDLFFSRTSWLDALLGALEQGRIPAGQIAAPQQQQLLNYKQAEIRQRAARLFHVSADRQKILQAYAEVETLRGDPAKGRESFQKVCAVCHRLKDEGNAIGPDLGMMSDKPVSDFLIAILDPNRSIEARYVNYTALLKNEREISGIIVTETANSITLKNSSSPEETVLRSDLQDLRSSGLSLMPEGLENAFKPQDLADLISYLKSR